MADLAGDVDVGQEVHLDLDGAVAGAGLAAAAAHVEGEPPGQVTPHLRLVRLGEELADVVEHPGIGGRVRTGRAPDGRLVDVDHLVQVLDALDRAVAPGQRLGPVQLLRQDAEQDVVDEGRLARSRDPGDRHQAAQWERHVDPLQVVLAGAADRDHLAGARSAPGRDRDGALAREVLAGDGALVGEQAPPAGDRSGVDHRAAVLPRARPDVHHVVGRPDRLLVVLHHDDRVAQVAQSLQRPDQALVVSLVQADGGLVEHVEHAHQPAADLAGQPDALRLAARQGPGRPGQGEIVEADIEQELHPLADLLEDAVGDHVLPVAELEVPMASTALAIDRLASS